MLFTKSVTVWVLRGVYPNTSVKIQVKADTLEAAKLLGASMLERGEGGDKLIGLEYLDSRQETVVTRI